jgi:uncharacterized membrane protein YfcA
MEYFGYLASILIGTALGLIGGGGSILTVPVLVSLFAVQPGCDSIFTLYSRFDKCCRIGRLLKGLVNVKTAIFLVFRLLFPFLPQGLS